MKIEVINRNWQTTTFSHATWSCIFHGFYKQDWIGVIDGTEVTAHVLKDDQISYRGKYKQLTQNIMCACGFDMKFTYVLSCWEGTTNDARIFLECISNPQLNFSKPPEGMLTF